jgi:hypothetical protein
VFWAAGRERGTYFDGGAVKPQSIRTSRIFNLSRAAAGKFTITDRSKIQRFLRTFKVRCDLPRVPGLPRHHFRKGKAEDSCRPHVANGRSSYNPKSRQRGVTQVCNRALNGTDRGPRKTHAVDPEPDLGGLIQVDKFRIGALLAHTTPGPRNRSPSRTKCESRHRSAPRTARR